MKPRLKLLTGEGYFCYLRWMCKSLEYCGFGATPMEAYTDWEAKKKFYHCHSGYLA